MHPQQAPICSLLRLVFLVSLCLIAAVSTARAELQTIHYPGGGEILYGAVSSDEATLPGAMGVVLRAIHGHFGERPQIGKFFRAKGSNSVATFFTVTAKKDGGKHMAGLAIVTLPASGTPAGAILYDEATRFKTTAGPMMKKLNEAWHPEGSAAATSGHAAEGKASPAGKAAPLRATTFPDNSGSIGLPAGWQITGGGAGEVHAQGPNGEQIHYGVIIPVMDPSNPQTRQMIQMETQGGRVPLPGSYTSYPSGGDPVRSFLAISEQTARKYRQPVPTYHFTKVTDMGRAPGGNCTQAIGDIDRHDGKGVLSAATTICMGYPQSGVWIMTLYQDAVPTSLRTEETPTLAAIAASYKLNNAVINAQTTSNIQAIKQIGHDAVQRSRDSEAAFEGQIAQHDRNADIVDRTNQGFENYILDQTVVQDNDRNERATVYNGYADSLVQADPNRYQYVPTQDMLKGVDY